MISSLIAHALLNRIQVILSKVELNEKDQAIQKLRELSNFVVARTATEEIQEPGKLGES